jgi:CTP-dependent riboflavin kinase
MSRDAEAYERGVGVRLEPGSLNIVLDEPWVMGDPAVRLDVTEVGVGVGLVPCTLGDLACWVLRTDRNDAGIGDHPLTVVEVVATVHLRTELLLSDGDEVALHLLRESASSGSRAVRRR